ncbi:MAG: glycosyltransferase, partial [Lachnospiraceae bacterium]|nr:glycosyltransferase [Lachnospiraceae bacterium]
NFSYMCNLGASYAHGDYLLFLNDDMEIIEADWLEKMLEKASLPYAGAVGAKLLYPDSDIIQHAGITNLRIGPAHKLQFLSDKEDHYYGRNRYVHDMMAVTGACLLVKRAVFDKAGGFDEELKVAFNDVDLCYTIYEKGYYNIQRNDVRLYHHESLSRGNDSDSDEKMKRMNDEKDRLYAKHQHLYGVDPFYNINLTTDMWEYEYAPKYHYEVNLNRPWARVIDITDTIKKAREDGCVRVGMECAMDIYKWKHGVGREASGDVSKEDLGYYLQGYTFVTGSNNACFERTLMLENTESGQIFGVEVSYEYRPDIAGNVPDQLNVDLAGYTAKLRADSVPEGHYRFGMYMKDKTSSLRLYNMSNWTIDISRG